MSIYCLICNKEFSDLPSLSRHCYIHGITSHGYYDRFLKKENEGLCIVCNEAAAFISIVKGYRLHCGQKCGCVTGLHKQWNDGEKSLIRKEKLKNRFKHCVITGRPKGSKNKNPYPQSEKVLQRYKDHPPPSFLGKHHSDETIKLKSKIMQKYIEKHGFQMSFKGIYKIKNPKKYIGDSTNIIWRSTWEHKFMHYLDNTPSVLSWSSEELYVGYFDPTTNKSRRYFPDFYMKVKQNNGNIEEFLVEVKPYHETVKPELKKRKIKAFNEKARKYIVNQSKWDAATQFCESKGWHFKIITEHELFGTKTK